MALCDDVANDKASDVVSDMVAHIAGDVANKADDALVAGVDNGVGGSSIFRH